MSTPVTQIDGLHEIALPEAVSYLPQTVGWYLLLALIVALLVWLSIRWTRHSKANRYRSFALSRLEELERQLELEAGVRSTSLTALPLLVKQTALEAYRRDDVASLSGEAWLKFLNKSYGGVDFTEGAGRLLPVLSYVSPNALQNINDDQITGLIDLVRKWIKHHQIPKANN